MTDARQPRIIVGMIVPPENGPVPPEAHELYPDGVDFLSTGLGLSLMTRQSYEEALERLPEAVDTLRAGGAQVLSLMGTSLSFHGGKENHERIVATLRQLSGGVPVSTMASSIVNGLRSLDASRVLVASPYSDAVARALTLFLTESGFEVVGSRNLGLENIKDLESLGDDDLVALGESMLLANSGAQALVLSCGGLRTARVTQILENRWGIPVVSSSIAAVIDVVRLADPTRRPVLDLLSVQ